LQDILVHKLPNCRSFHFRSRGEFDDRFHDLTPSDAIGTILGIVAVTSLSVKSFVVDFGMWQVDATRFQMWQYHQPSFRSGWSHVRELSLSLSLTSGTFDWALGLIVHATSLWKLSLVFKFDHSASFIERLCSSNVVHELESLRLISAVITLEKLSELIVRYQDSLRVLSFQHILIESGSEWPTVLTQFQDQLLFLKELSVQ